MEAASYVISIIYERIMNNTNSSSSELRDLSSPFEIYPPLACHIPLDGGDAPTFNYVICAIYSFACLLVVLTGGYFYIQRFGAGKASIRASTSRPEDNGNDVYRPTTLRKSRDTSLLCGLSSL